MFQADGKTRRKNALAEARDQRHLVTEPFQIPQGLAFRGFLVPLDKVISA